MKNNFEKLGISEEMKDLLNKEGIKEPTPIQLQTIPVLIAGKDVIAQAQTGTGKTLAFMLPIMEKIDINKPYIQALIITPTRELAIQITAEAKKLASIKDVKILSAYGGQDVEAQIRKLKKGIHIVIGTPGRLLDHLRRKSIDINKVSMFVLDEADQMLHMGFLKEVEDIMGQLPKVRQTMFFSATIPNGVRTMSTRYMKQPAQIHIESKNVTLDEIRQIVIQTTDRGKQEALCKLIDEYKPFMAIIFCRTKRRVSALNFALGQLGYNSEELHGDLTQAKRERVMKAFRKADIQLLIATDVAARGLDIEGVTHVFNYDIPQYAEYYIHRIGRTGRAGHRGIAITFVTSRDREALKSIEKEIGMTIEKVKAENYIEKENSHKESRERKPRDRDYRKNSKTPGTTKASKHRISGKSRDEKGNTNRKKQNTRNKKGFSNKNKS